MGSSFQPWGWGSREKGLRFWEPGISDKGPQPRGSPILWEWAICLANRFFWWGWFWESRKQLGKKKKKRLETQTNCHCKDEVELLKTCWLDSSQTGTNGLILAGPPASQPPSNVSLWQKLASWQRRNVVCRVLAHPGTDCIGWTIAEKQELKYCHVVPTKLSQIGRSFNFRKKKYCSAYLLIPNPVAVLKFSSGTHDPRRLKGMVHNKTVLPSDQLATNPSQSVSSVAQLCPLFATPWTAACQTSLSITTSWSPSKPMSIKLMMPSNHLILCHPLLLLPSIFPSIRVFSSESALHIRWPKDWSSRFNISPSNEHPGLISFRMDWLDLLAVQGTVKSLLQHYSSEASILQCSTFFRVQLSHPYMTSRKTIALPRWTFVGKVMSLLFNLLSRLVITFLPRSKRLLISWLQSPSAVILEARKVKSATVFTISPSICHEVMGPDVMILVFWMLSFKPTFSLSSFTFIKKLFSSSSLSAIRVVSSACLRLLMFLLAVLIPACAYSSPVFLMIYSAYELNKQGDSIQPWCTPFPIWNQSLVPCPVLTVASWPYRFLKRQVRWSGIPISFRIFHSLLWSTQSKALA